MHIGDTDLEAARTALVDILYQRSFLLSVPLAPVGERNRASDQRKAERIKRPKSGRVRCRFQHDGRWRQWKEAEPREAIRIGFDGKSLVDSKHWVLCANGDDWHEHHGEPSPEAATPIQAPCSAAPDDWGTPPRPKNA